MRFLIILILFVLPQITQAQTQTIGVVNMDSLIGVSKEFRYLDSVRQSLFHKENIMIASVGEQMLSSFEREYEKATGSTEIQEALGVKMREVEQEIVRIAETIDIENKERIDLIHVYVEHSLTGWIVEEGKNNGMNSIIDSQTVYYHNPQKVRLSDITSLLQDELESMRGDAFGIEQQMRVKSRGIQSSIQALIPQSEKKGVE